MANLEKDLAQLESPLGVIPGEVLRLWYNKVDNLDELYTEFVEQPIRYRGPKAPVGYVGKKGDAKPVKIQQLNLIIALSKIKFEHRYNLQEACDLLATCGAQISRQGLIKVNKRIAETLNITDVIPKGRNVNIKSLADAEELVQRERRNFAKEAKKKGLTGEEVREQLTDMKKDGVVHAAVKSKKKSKASVESQESLNQEEFAGREVIYEPTAKQILFHAASEKIVLYGGAAGKQ